MIQMQTSLDIADNSGAKRAVTITVLGQNKRYAGVGDIVTATVKEAAPDGAVKKGEVVRVVTDDRPNVWGLGFQMPVARKVRETDTGIRHGQPVFAEDSARELLVAAHRHRQAGVERPESQRRRPEESGPPASRNPGEPAVFLVDELERKPQSVRGLANSRKKPRPILGFSRTH